jgi:hypothetical protein
MYPPELEVKETKDTAAETVSLQRRQICYRWGTPAYWSLVPRSSMFYLFEFCLKNMWNCSLTHQILSHSFYDWKLCELVFKSTNLIYWHCWLCIFLGQLCRLVNISDFTICNSISSLRQGASCWLASGTHI